MKAIFFNYPDSFEKAVPKIYSAIGIKEYMEGDSLHVLGGVYGTYSIFGIEIKVEENSYEYEDEYRYMIFIKKDVHSNIWTPEEYEAVIARMVCGLLHHNLQTEIAVEVDDKLEIYHQPK